MYDNSKRPPWWHPRLVMYQINLPYDFDADDWGRLDKCLLIVVSVSIRCLANVSADSVNTYLLRCPKNK